MAKEKAKSFHCKCLEKFERENQVTTSILVTLAFKSEKGWKKTESLGPDHINYCPICGRTPEGRNLQKKKTDGK